jgi:FtsP/CotA-like multicopper oxidase with cupredoxin domain
MSLLSKIVKRFPFIALLALIATACLHDAEVVPATNPKTYSRSTEGLPEATAMKTLDIAQGDSLRLEMAPAKARIDGITTRLLVYGGSFPGPVIRVKQGSHIFLNVVNHTDAPTTLHPHGLRLDYHFDGVPNYTQKPIAPGDSFTYRLDFPDPGMYWYHPHVRSDYQADMGLYGAFIVTPTDTAYWGPPADREEVLILDDMLLDSGGIAEYKTDGADHVLMGRFGNTLLINGRTDYTLNVKRHEIVRFFILNASSVRVFNLKAGNSLWRMLGSDYGRSYQVDFLSTCLISPAERYVAEAHFMTPGEYPLEHRTPVKYLTTGPYYAPNSTVFAPPPEQYPVMGRVLVDSQLIESDYYETFYNSESTSLPETNFPVTQYAEKDSLLDQKPDFMIELSVAMDHKKLPMSLMPAAETTGVGPSVGYTDSAQYAFKAAQREGGSPEAAPFFIPYLARDTAGNPIEPGSPGEVTPLGIRRAPAQSWIESQHGSSMALAKTAHNDPLGLGVEWYDDMPEMNALSNTENTRWIMRDYNTGLENMAVRWQLKKGKLYHIRIWNNYNTMHPMAHFIHFHGQRSMLIGKNGVPENNATWKDTFLISMGSMVDIVLEANNLGGWMAHCHIAEHAEASMMMFFRVDE